MGEILCATNSEIVTEINILEVAEIILAEEKGTESVF